MLFYGQMADQIIDQTKDYRLIQNGPYLNLKNPSERTNYGWINQTLIKDGADLQVKTSYGDTVLFKNGIRAGIVNQSIPGGIDGLIEKLEKLPRRSRSDTNEGLVTALRDFSDRTKK